MLPLVHAKTSKIYRITKVPNAPLLRSLHIQVNQFLLVQSHLPFHGATIIKHGQSQLAIGYAYAKEIYVEECKNNDCEKFPTDYTKHKA